MAGLIDELANDLQVVRIEFSRHSRITIAPSHGVGNTQLVQMIVTDFGHDRHHLAAALDFHDEKKVPHKCLHVALAVQYLCNTVTHSREAQDETGNEVQRVKLFGDRS